MCRMVLRLMMVLIWHSRIFTVLSCVKLRRLLRVFVAFFALSKRLMTLINFLLVKLTYRLLVFLFIFVLSVRFISSLLVRPSSLELGALTILIWVFFYVVLPVMRLTRFFGMLTREGCNISILTVVVSTLLIVAIGVKEITIWVHKWSILVDIESILIIYTARRESFFLLWATLLVILFLFALSVIRLWSDRAAWRGTSGSRVSILKVLFVTYLLLWLIVCLWLYWFWILFLSCVTIVVWVILLIWPTTTASSSTSWAIIILWRLLVGWVLVYDCTHLNLLFLNSLFVRLSFILCSI